MKKLILILIVAAIAAAFAKNPSPADSKAAVKSEIVKAVQEDNDQAKESLAEIVGTKVTGFLAPTLVNNLVQVDVDNFYVFSTFEAYTNLLGNRKPVNKGFIVFGKVIVTSSEL